MSIALKWWIWHYAETFSNEQPCTCIFLLYWCLHKLLSLYSLIEKSAISDLCVSHLESQNERSFCLFLERFVRNNSLLLFVSKMVAILYF